MIDASTHWEYAPQNCLCVYSSKCSTDYKTLWQKFMHTVLRIFFHLRLADWQTDKPTLTHTQQRIWCGPIRMRMKKHLNKVRWALPTILVFYFFCGKKIHFPNSIRKKSLKIVEFYALALCQSTISHRYIWMRNYEIHLYLSQNHKNVDIKNWTQLLFDGTCEKWNYSRKRRVYWDSVCQNRREKSTQQFMWHNIVCVNQSIKRNIKLNTNKRFRQTKDETHHNNIIINSTTFFSFVLYSSHA